MGRPLASLVVLALFVGAVGASWAFEPVDAQDTTEGRLAALETRVAEQDDTISGHGREIERLENRVEDLEDDGDVVLQPPACRTPATAPQPFRNDSATAR